MSRLDELLREVGRLRVSMEVLAIEVGIDLDAAVIAHLLGDREPSNWHEMRAVGRDPITGEASP